MMPSKSILKISSGQRRGPNPGARNNFSVHLIPSPPQRPPAESKNIAFNRQTRVYLIPTLSEWTQEECDACFVTDAESKASQEETRDNIIAMRQGLNDNDEDSGLCFRGIEYMRSVTSFSQRNNHKAHATNSILDAQDEVEDPEHIAAVSRRVTLLAVESALAKASSDAAFVRRMQRNDASRSPTSTFGDNVYDQYVHQRSRALQNTLDDALRTSSSTTNNRRKRRRIIPHIPQIPISIGVLALDLAQCSLGSKAAAATTNEISSSLQPTVPSHDEEDAMTI